MSKLALLVGINRYESDDFEDLVCCEADAEEMDRTLSRHWSADASSPGERNFNTRLITSGGKRRISADFLRSEINNLMNRPMGDGEVLFYFSGHGVTNDKGGFLVTQDGTAENPGFPMTELLEAANRSGNASAVIVLDCCNSGAIGNMTDIEGFNRVSISPNVTILAASGATQHSSEGWKHSTFTQHVLDALAGGAADCRGEVSAAAVYAYAEQALGPWEQRPVYKSYARKLSPIRKCKPAVPDSVLARLTDWFPTAESGFRMDRTYEREEKAHAIADHVAVFDQFKLLRNAHLLEGESGLDLYWTAINEKLVYLTPQGRLFWSRARRGDF